MNYLTIIIGVFGLVGIAGGLAAWYKRSEGKDSLELAQTSIQMYKDRELIYVQKAAEQVAIIEAQNKTVLELRTTIKTMIKEFKDYKNGNN